MAQIDEVCVNQIRVLAADTVEKAKSGHPGAPMGMAAMAHVLWGKVMNYAPHDPKWANRDRFVLSNGHSCALIYTMLHLSGFNLSINDLKSFRQLHSKTPGHPEDFVTEGVEVTTGPLGQGISNAVGMAIGERHMAARFNKPGYQIIDNYTYVFCGDGCLQEGVSSEAASIAGHLGLGKLIVLYDDNNITIDGETDLSFSEDVLMRFRSYGWHTLTVANGDSDLRAIEEAIQCAKSVHDQPTIIAVKTTIGFGSSKQGKESVHGAPLGGDDLKNVKTKFGFDPKRTFEVKKEASDYYTSKVSRGKKLVSDWSYTMKAYAQKYPVEASEFARRQAGILPRGWEACLPTFNVNSKGDATRNLSGKVLNAIAGVLPELIGGSADLTPSNKTALKGIKDFQKGSYEGRYLRFGVREHGMAAIANGLHAYGGYIPFTATFLNFIEYAYGAVRLSALCGYRQLYIMTHDSIGLGEDGPTHQPVEAIPLCRATPNMLTFRPADGNEVAGAYRVAVQFKGPSVLCLSRQGMPSLAQSSQEKTMKGAYVAVDCAGNADLILIGTGSEVGLCMAAAKKLESRGMKVRVVSMPCTELFDQQPVSYRRQILTPGVATVSVEAAGIHGWSSYAHHSIGMTTFGASAPIKDVMKLFGFTPDQVVENVTTFLTDFRTAANDTGVAPSFSLLPTHFNTTKKGHGHSKL